MSRDTFVREAQTGIDRLSDGLLELEERGERETVDDLFRSAHSLKSTFGMEGYEDASELAHAMEDVLEAVRGEQLEAEAAVIDEMFEGVDTLEQMLEEIEREGELRVDPTEQIQALRRTRDAAQDGDGRSEATGGSSQSNPDSRAATGADETEEADIQDQAVREALEAASEFDDLDALAEELDDTGDLDPPEEGAVGAFGSLDIGADARTATDETSDGVSVDGDEDEDPSQGTDGETELEDEEVREALEAASEFDDLDALAEELDDAGDIGPVSEAGSVAIFGTDRSRQSQRSEQTPPDEESGEGTQQSGDGSSDEEVASESGGQFAEIKGEVAQEEMSLEALQAEIEAESFGQFDDEDEMSIHELLGLEPEESSRSVSASDGRTDVSDAGDTAGGADTAERKRPETPTEPESRTEAPTDEGPVPTEEQAAGLSPEGDDGVTATDSDQTPAVGASREMPSLEGVDAGPKTADTESTADIDTVGSDSGMKKFESRFGSLFDTDESATSREVATIEHSSLSADRFRPDRRPSALETTESVQSLTIDIEYADELLSLVEELSLDSRRLQSELDGEEQKTAKSLENTVEMLQQTVMKIRLMPVETITRSLGRVVREAARSTDTDVELTVEGAGTRVDRSIIDRLRDPLVHLVRNAVDHGIEPPETREAAGKDPTGTITVRVRRTGEHMTVEVRDDGRGIDPDEVRAAAVEADVCSREEVETLSDEAVYELITYPGLSTVEEVTSTSGRGVGMDVVRESVEAVNGHLTVESTPGEGTVMRIRVPVTMAVTDLVFVETCGQEFALPVADVVRVDAGERIVDRTEQKSVDRRLDLGRALEVGSVEADTPREVTVETPDGTVVVECDEVLDQRNAIVTPYDELLAGIPELSGATTGTEEQLVHVLEVTNI